MNFAAACHGPRGGLAFVKGAVFGLRDAVDLGKYEGGATARVRLFQAEQRSEGVWVLEAKCSTAVPDAVRAPASTSGLRLGVIAVDPLRAIGLGAILEDALPCTIHTVALESLGNEKALAAVVLDAAADDAEHWTLVSAVSALHPLLPVLVLGDSLSVSAIRQVHAAGARGYLSNTALEAEILECVSSVLGGSRWPKGLETIPETPLATSTEMADAEEVRELPLRERLTPRECEVMNLLLDGRSNKEIAIAMRIDEATVKAHLGRMLRKARCSNRVELTLLAMSER